MRDLSVASCLRQKNRNICFPYGVACILDSKDVTRIILRDSSIESGSIKKSKQDLLD